MSRVEKEQVNNAIRALYAFMAKQKENDQKSYLFEEESDIMITIAMKKTPEKQKTKPIRIPIKHTIYGRDGQDICVFTKDPTTEYKDLIDANPVEGVNKVIGVTKLRKNYGQYKDKRDLLTSHDLFLADERIVPLLPALLGKKFFMKKKQPVPVCLTRKKLKEELSAARDSTYLFLSAGPCCAFKVATSAFTKLQVLENVMSSIDAAVDKIPRKWKNVQAIHIKTHDSVALPIFNSLPGTARPAATVARPPAKKGKRKLSTKKKASIKSKKSKQ